MCFVGFEKTLLREVTSTDHLVHASTPETTQLLGGEIGRKGPNRKKRPKKYPNGGELDVEGAAGHPRSRDGAGRSERRLARSTAREVEKSDCEVRFSARPSLPELEVALPSLPIPPAVCSLGIPGFERAV